MDEKPAVRIDWDDGLILEWASDDERHDIDRALPADLRERIRAWERGMEDAYGRLHEDDPPPVDPQLNAAHLGEPSYAETLQPTIVLDVRTPDSLLPARRTDEGPELQSSGWNSQAFFPVRRHGGHGQRSWHCALRATDIGTHCADTESMGLAAIARCGAHALMLLVIERSSAEVKSQGMV